MGWGLADVLAISKWARQTPFARITRITVVILFILCPEGTALCLYTPNASGHVVIPSTDTTTSELSFYNCTSLLSVYIPDTVVSLGFVALGDSALSAVQLPDSVVSIGKAAFIQCLLLSTAQLSSSLTFIGNGAFSGCVSLRAISIPDGVPMIPGDCCSRCVRLTNLHIADSVTYIGLAAFLACDSHTVVTIPDSVRFLDQYAFVSQSITSVTIPLSVTFVGGGSFSLCIGFGLGTATSNMTGSGASSHYSPIPRGVISCIPCYNQTTLPSVTNATVSIGYSSFTTCTSLQQVQNLPNSIVAIQESVRNGAVTFDCGAPQILFCCS